MVGHGARESLISGGGSKRSASYAAPQTVDNQADESRNTKLNCVPCGPGQVAVPPKKEHLPPISPLPSVNGPYQPPPIAPVGPGDTNEPSFVEIHEPDPAPPSLPASPASAPTPPVALPPSPSVPFLPPRAPPSQSPITIALPPPSRPAVAPSPSYGPAPAPPPPKTPSRPEEPSPSSPETNEELYGPAQASESPASGPSESVNVSPPVEPSPSSPAAIPSESAQPGSAPFQPEPSYGPAPAPPLQPAPPTIVEVIPTNLVSPSSASYSKEGTPEEYDPRPSVSIKEPDQSREESEIYQPNSSSPQVEPVTFAPAPPVEHESEEPSPVEQPAPSVPFPSSPSYGSEHSAPKQPFSASPRPTPVAPSIGPILPPPLPPLPPGPSEPIVSHAVPAPAPFEPSPSYGPAPGTGEVDQGPPPSSGTDISPPDVPVMIALPPPKSSYTGEEENGGEVDVSQEEVNPSDRRPELSSISAESSYENISKNKGPTGTQHHSMPTFLQLFPLSLLLTTFVQFPLAPRAVCRHPFIHRTTYRRTRTKTKKRILEITLLINRLT